MQFRFLIVFSMSVFQLANAQTKSHASAHSRENTARTTSTALSATSANTSGTMSSVTTTSISGSSAEVAAAAIPPPPGFTNTLIVDYKSVYEAPTLEEEVKTAAERFELTPDQQDIWARAAIDRREGERQFREKYDSKASNYEKDGAYRRYRTSQNTFYETIIGYLSPRQKQLLERDRLIIEERDKRLAKLPPEPAAAQTTTVTVVPTTFGQDSTAVKQKGETKRTHKKSKKKKTAVVK